SGDMRRVVPGMAVALVLNLMSAAVAAPETLTNTASANGPLKREELEQLLAPIAIYPDALLTQMLMASTYPLEIVQADRWVREHPGLKGDALAKELEKEDWD